MTRYEFDNATVTFIGFLGLAGAAVGLGVLHDAHRRRPAQSS
jgi:hypothetical protein